MKRNIHRILLIAVLGSWYTITNVSAVIKFFSPEKNMTGFEKKEEKQTDDLRTYQLPNGTVVKSIML